MKRTRIAMGAMVVLMNLALLTSAGPALWAGGSYQADVNDSDRFEARNDVRRVELKVGCNATKMTVRFQASLTRGMMTWRLLDPQGKVQAEGEAVPGQPVADSRAVKPAEGRWVLEIKWLGATGSHDVNWLVR